MLRIRVFSALKIPARGLYELEGFEGLGLEAGQGPSPKNTSTVAFGDRSKARP